MTSGNERRLRSGLAIVAMIGLTFATLGFTAIAGSAPSTDAMDVNMNQAPLGRAIQMLAKQAGIDVIMAMTDEESHRKVSYSCTSQPAQMVLTDILTAAKVDYRKTESGAYVIGSPVLFANPSAASCDKMYEAIRLKHSTASDIAKEFVPVSDGGGAEGSKSPRMIPKGIDLVKPIGVDNALLVHGNKDSITELKAVVAKLDVPPKQVELFVATYQVSAEHAGKLGIKWTKASDHVVDYLCGPSSSDSDASLKIIRKSLPPPPSIPSESTPDGIAIRIAVCPDRSNWLLTVLPRVNEDRTITLHFDGWTEMEDDCRIPQLLEAMSSVNTDRTIKDGDSLVIGGIGNSDTGGEIAVATVRVVE